MANRGATLISMARVDDVLDWPERADASGGPASALLSVRERRRWERIRHPRRRREYVAARLLVKHAFLETLSRPARGPRASPGWAPWLERVGSGDLPRALSSASGGATTRRAFHDLEVLALEPAQPGRPRVVWRGRDLSDRLSVSISHAGGWVVAALSSEGVIGVDIETVEERPPCFTGFALTPEERTWVQRTVSRWATPAVLRTLLWTLKEAVFKAGELAGRPPWRAEIVLGRTPLAAFAGDPGPPGGPLPGINVGLRRVGPPRASCAAGVVTPDWVMCVVGRSGAGRKDSSWTC